MGLIYDVDWILGIAALAIFILGIIRFIRNAASTKSQKEGYQMMVWGVVAMFVIFSLQGILWFLYSGLISTSAPQGGNSCSSNINDTGDKNLPGGTTPFQSGPGSTNTLQG